MDSFYTDDQRMIRDAARDFATEQPRAARGAMGPRRATARERRHADGRTGLSRHDRAGRMGRLLHRLRGLCARHRRNRRGLRVLRHADERAQLGRLRADSRTSAATRRKSATCRTWPRAACIGAFCLTEPQAGSEAQQSAHPRRAAGRQVDSQRQQAVRDQRLARRHRDRVRRHRSGAAASAACPRSSCRRIRPASTSASRSTSSASARPIPVRFRSTTAPCRKPICWASRAKGLRIALSNLEGGRIGIAAQARRHRARRVRCRASSMRTSASSSARRSRSIRASPICWPT